MSETAEHALLALGEFWIKRGNLFRERVVSLATSGSRARYDHEHSPQHLSAAWIGSGKLLAAYDAARAAAKLWAQGEVHFIADYALLRAVLVGNRIGGS